MKWSMFLILTAALSLIFCASCGTDTPETTSERALAQPTQEPDPGPDKIFIHFDTSTHEIIKVIVPGPDPDNECPGLPPPANLDEAKIAAKGCFETEFPDAVETEPVLKIDTFTVNPTMCVIYDARGNRYFVPCS